MSTDLARGREAFRQREWDDAFSCLQRADEVAPLSVEDRERLSEAAYLLGRDDDYLAALERLLQDHLAAGNAEAAARAAFWSGLKLIFRGEAGRATGQFARARRLLEHRDCVEQGYLRLVTVEERFASGDHHAARDAAVEAAAIGERFGDRDLVACARQLQGTALLLAGRIETGLPLLDEAMAAVIAGELSPIVTGLIYCNVIEVCGRVHEHARAREWTAALAAWCERQPKLIAFTTACLVHRAEVLCLQGAWPDAIAEARRACERVSSGTERKPPAAAFYQQAEVHRLRGDFFAAEEAYQLASRGGWDPQPGLALLRLAEGREHAATAAIRRALATTTEPLARVRLLPAAVEILAEAGADEDAAAACADLDAIAARFSTPMLAAMAAEARGTLALAAGRPEAALAPLGEAHAHWQRMDAPYLTARVRLRLGLAARALGDEEGARLELDAARTVFARLGAASDLARVDRLIARPPTPPAGALTRRELQVLRLVATGRTNRAIAAALDLSERTVERHLSNIFTKLDVSTRAAATAHAYRHRLV